LVYEPGYSIYHSIKSIGLEVGDLLLQLKKPRTWFAILIFVMVYGIITKDILLLKWAPISILIVYWLRQRIDGKYKRELKLKALMHNNDIILKEEYEKYKRTCYFSKKEALDYELWKKEELTELKSNKS